MKHLHFLKGSLLLVAVLFFSSNLFAQEINLDCYGLDVVAKSCVGACDNPSTLTYQVTGPCPSLSIPMCLSNLNSNLCPSHRAIAQVRVNGQLVARGEITAVGSNISFSAICGSTVKVYVKAIDVVQGIECIQLGNLDYGISR